LVVFAEFGGVFIGSWCGLQVHSGIRCRTGLAKDPGEAEAMKFTLSCGQVQVGCWVAPFSSSWAMLLIQ
jgi:hypothetical protein